MRTVTIGVLALLFGRGVSNADEHFLMFNELSYDSVKEGDELAVNAKARPVRDGEFVATPCEDTDRSDWRVVARNVPEGAANVLAELSKKGGCVYVTIRVEDFIKLRPNPGVSVEGPFIRVKPTTTRKEGSKNTRPGKSAGPVKQAPVAGCAKDTDCKGDRICEDGRCTNPH